MATRGRNVPVAGRGTTSASARATNALVEMETAEPEAVKLIRSIGKDPERKLGVEAIEALSALYGEGKRGERRRWLLDQSVRYLFDGEVWSEERVLRFLGGLRARTKVMVDFMVAFWDGEYRPKTWVDQLSAADQERWVFRKREYSRRIESLNQELERAKSAYAAEVRRIQTAQFEARFELQDVLKDMGVVDAPLLRSRTDDDLVDELSRELAELGVNFRPFQGREEQTRGQPPQFTEARPTPAH